MKPTYEELELQLEESQREFRAADATIHNLELKLTDMAVQLANAESKCRELAAENAALKDAGSVSGDQAARGSGLCGSGGSPMVARSSSHFGLGLPSSK